MPTDEFGDKWACEPCIRGHRSTKCEHFDRFMMRVKKPGRPLTTCPHTKSQCTCTTERVIMVRIAKGEKCGECSLPWLIQLGSGCHCVRAPAYPSASDRDGADNSQPSVYSHFGAPPLVPAPLVPEKIQQPNYHPVELFSDPKTPQRQQKPNFLPITSIRESKNTIFNTHDSIPNPRSPLRLQTGTQSDDLSNLQLPLVTGLRDSLFVGTPGNSSESSEYFQSAAVDESESSRSLEKQDGAAIGVHRSGAEKLETAKTQNKSGCCCSSPRKSTPPLEPEARQPEPVNYSLPGSSRVGADSEARRLEISIPRGYPLRNNHITERHHLRESQESSVVSHSEKDKDRENSPYVHGFSPPQLAQVPQMTVYSMPATYATAENPLTARQQEYFQRNSHVYTQQVPHYAPLGVVGSAAPPAEADHILSLAHNCDCGPTCQCIFCVAHPYNEPTRDRVQCLADLLSSDGVYSPENHLSPYGSPFHSPADSSNIPSTNHRMHIEDILHPSDLPQSGEISSSGYGSGGHSAIPNGSLAEAAQPAISSSGYLTMEYEFASISYDRCMDSTGTCRCQDACDCVGCLTHSGHDGETLRSVI